MGTGLLVNQYCIHVICSFLYCLVTSVYNNFIFLKPQNVVFWLIFCVLSDASVDNMIVYTESVQMWPF